MLPKTPPRVRPRRSRSWIPASLVFLLLGGGYLTLDALDVAPGFITLSHPWPDPTAFPTPTLPQAEPAPAPDQDEQAPLPSAQEVERLVQNLIEDPRVGPNPGVVVTDAATGEVLASANGEEALIPASTTKLLTGVAVLHAYGPTERITTPVVRGAKDDPDAVTIIGTGDVTLDAGAGDDTAVIGHGGVEDLARQVAQQLKAHQVDSVTDVVVDESAWEGPRMAPRWDDRDLAEGWIIPQSPLALDLGRIEGQAARSAQPGLEVGQALATALEDEGIEVSGEVRSGHADDDADELASVESAPVAELVEYMLVYSDNVLAESLGRLVATQGGYPASFEGVEDAVVEALSGLGVSTDGLRLADSSGLSSKNRITPLTLVETLEVASRDHPDLLASVRGLPVAGLEGTLRHRMVDSPAAGVVSAKTGSLRTVATIAGQVYTLDGRLVHVAVMTSDWDGSLDEARQAIDSFLIDVAECGCDAG